MADLLKNKRFLIEIEHQIRLINNDTIHEVIPPISSERMLSISSVVAKLRARYIQAVYKFTDSELSDGEQGMEEINELALCRRQFEEIRDAFIAISRAIELGYISIE